MSSYYRFIATKTTSSTPIPAASIPQSDLMRRLRQMMATTAGGATRVGEIRDFPLATAQPYMLLCDGSEIPKADFPELYDYLGDTQGTPADSNDFVLPNYEASSTIAVAWPTQTISGGTVSTGGSISTPTGAGQTGGTTGGNVPSGSRV